MIVTEIDAASVRELTPEVDVSRRFPGRWSARAMAGPPLTRAELAVLFEAARWAPSCFNSQPWRFAYALKDGDHWDPLFRTLAEGNRIWVENAGALVAVITRETFEHNGKPAPTHSFDGGAAWMSLALQAAECGLVAHAMQGFDGDAARRVLAVPEGFDLPALIAIGHPGNIDDLPEPVREREHPTPRKALTEIVFEGGFDELES